MSHPDPETPQVPLELEDLAQVGRGTRLGELKEIKRAVDDAWRRTCQHGGRLYSANHAGVKLEGF